MMSAASTPGSAPKAMSSRLLTMKFMQRAANSSQTSAGLSIPEGPSLKRRRTNSEDSPPQRSADAFADRKAVQSALAVEEAKRQAALDKQAADAGDTRWVLSFDSEKRSIPSARTLRTVQIGYANLDASPSKMRMEKDDEISYAIGRRSFGKFNKILEKQQDPAYQDSEDSDSAEDDEDQGSGEESESNEDDPMSRMIKQERREAAERARAERKARKRAAQEDLGQMAKKRRKQEINLNSKVDLHNLTSLSGRQEAPVKRKEVECFRCGGPHMKRDCPVQKRHIEDEESLIPRKLKRYS